MMGATGPTGLERLRELTSQLVAAEEEKQLFRQAVEQMQDALVLVKDNLICYVNSSFCRMYGYAKAARKNMRSWAGSFARSSEGPTAWLCWSTRTSGKMAACSGYRPLPGLSTRIRGCTGLPLLGTSLSGSTRRKVVK